MFYKEKYNCELNAQHIFAMHVHFHASNKGIKVTQIQHTQFKHAISGAAYFAPPSLDSSMIMIVDHLFQIVSIKKKILNTKIRSLSMKCMRFYTIIRNTSDAIYYYIKGRNMNFHAFFKKLFLSGCYDQISEFFYCESLVLSGFILIYQGL